jgi:hypothetical protein
MGGDNPDNCYRLAGIAHGARYVVTGRAIGEAPRSVTFTLVANYGTSVTVQTLGYDELRRDADGAFEISIGPEAAAGAPNHLRTQPGVKFLFVRDSLDDWQAETPLALSIRRIDVAAAEPIGDEQIAARAVFRLIEEVPLYYWFSRLCSARTVNSAVPPIASGTVGGLVSQAGAQGRFCCGNDEAVVLTLDPAGARYANIEACDWWFRSIDSWQRTSSYTQSMSAPADDGSCTYVVSPSDPGVHNWVDTCGLHEVLMIYRWQGLPVEKVRDGPAIRDLRHVKLGDLRGVLPRDTVWISPQERERQRAARAKVYARRLLEY